MPFQAAGPLYFGCAGDVDMWGGRRRKIRGECQTIFISHWLTSFGLLFRETSVVPPLSASSMLRYQQQTDIGTASRALLLEYD